MGQITSLFVPKVIRQVSDCLDRRELLRDLGIDPDGAVDPSRMVSSADFYSFLEKIARFEFKAPWNRWNVIRTTLAVMASLILVVLCLRR